MLNNNNNNNNNTRRKICSSSSNKDIFIKMSLALVSTFRKKWNTEIIVIALSNLIILSHHEKLGIN